MLRRILLMLGFLAVIAAPSSLEAQDPRAIIIREMIARVSSWTTNFVATYGASELVDSFRGRNPELAISALQSDVRSLTQDMNRLRDAFLVESIRDPDDSMNESLRVLSERLVRIELQVERADVEGLFEELTRLTDAIEHLSEVSSQTSDDFLTLRDDFAVEWGSVRAEVGELRIAIKEQQELLRGLRRNWWETPAPEVRATLGGLWGSGSGEYRWTGPEQISRARQSISEVGLDTTVEVWTRSWRVSIGGALWNREVEDDRSQVTLIYSSPSRKAEGTFLHELGRFVIGGYGSHVFVDDGEIYANDRRATNTQNYTTHTYKRVGLLVGPSSDQCHGTGGVTWSAWERRSELTGVSKSEWSASPMIVLACRSRWLEVGVRGWREDGSMVEASARGIVSVTDALGLVLRVGSVYRSLDGEGPTTGQELVWGGGVGLALSMTR